MPAPARPSEGTCAPVGQATAAGAPCENRGSVGAFSADPLPCTQQPRFSLSGHAAHRLCTHYLRMPRHQLLPQSLAPHLLQLARPGFLRPQGTKAGGDTGNVGTGRSTALPSSGLQWGVPGNKGEESRGRGRMMDHQGHKGNDDGSEQ